MNTTIRYSFVHQGFLSSTNPDFFVRLKHPAPSDLEIEFESETSFWEWFQSEVLDGSNDIT